MSVRSTGVAAYRWTILAIVYLAFLAYAVVFQSIPPVLGFIAADIHLSHSEAGLLMSLFALPGVFLSIPAGLLADRYDPRRLMVGCLVVMLAGTLLVASGTSFAVLALGRAVAGTGGLSLFIIGAGVVSRWFAGREQGLASGIYSTSMPVGTLLSLGTLGAVAGSAGWRAALLGGAALSVLALAAFAVLYQQAPAGGQRQPLPGQGPAGASISALPPAIWLIGAIWMLFNAAVLSFITFGPDYFLSRGFGVEMAGLLAGVLMLLSPPLAPVVGHLVDRLGKAEAFIALGGTLVAAGILALATTTWPPISLLLVLSLGAVLVPTPVFSLPPRILRPQYLGIGYGIVSVFLNIGTVVGPYLTGLARDATGSYTVSFYLMAGFALLTVFFAGLLSLVCSRMNRCATPE